MQIRACSQCIMNPATQECAVCKKPICTECSYSDRDGQHACHDDWEGHYYCVSGFQPSSAFH
jgi:hypothetical protein